MVDESTQAGCKDEEESELESRFLDLPPMHDSLVKKGVYSYTLIIPAHFSENISDSLGYVEYSPFWYCCDLILSHVVRHWNPITFRVSKGCVKCKIVLQLLEETIGKTSLAQLHI